LTYMEVRFLVDDLGLSVQDQEKVSNIVGDLHAQTPQGDSQRSAPPMPTSPLDASAPGPGEISVSLDEVARPGTMISGKVTFSDGKLAEWQLDQFGRLGLIPAEEGYKPSEEDLQKFQAQLQQELSRMGL